MFKRVKDSIYWRWWAVRLRMHQIGNAVFDRIHGVDTATEIMLTDIGIPQDKADEGNERYRPFWANEFHKIMGYLSIDCSQFTFIDVGSGKGKVLFLASNYVFRRIIGVEFSEQLHSIAINNCRTYRSARQKCKNIQLRCIDARYYEIPKEPCVIFIFNAMKPKILREIFNNFAQQASQLNIPIYFVYANLRNVREVGAAFNDPLCMHAAISRKTFTIYTNLNSIETPTGETETREGLVMALSRQR